MMIEPNFITANSESSTANTVEYKPKSNTEIIHTLQPLKVITEVDSETIKENDKVNSQQTNNIEKSTSVPQETTLDIELDSIHVLEHPKRWLARYSLRQLNNKNHLPNHEFSPGHLSRYSNEYHSQQSYTPQDYNQQVFFQRNAEPKSGGGPFKGWFSSNEEEEAPPIPYDPETRNQFIRKILILVLVMLIFTSGFVALVLFEPGIRSFFRQWAIVLIITSSLIVLILSYAVACSACTKRAPWSYIVLVLTTLAMSVLAACISSRYKTEIVLYAVAATAAVVMVCLGLSFTRFDFTKWLLFLIVISVAVSIVGIIILISMKATGKQMKTVHLVLLIIVVILLAVGLVIELQMIIGGKSVQLEDDEYAMGAFMVYTSIVHIFINLVQIIGLIHS